MMDTQKAIALAKRYTNDFYKDESISNIGLEEVEFSEDEKSWRITIGFSRPWDQNMGALLGIGTQINSKRTYKIVQIKDEDGSLISLKNRDVG